MNNSDSSESNSNSSGPHKPLATTNTTGHYSTFPEHTEVAMAVHSPPVVPLSQLRDQSAFIQCPHCLDHVYTKISSADMSDAMLIFSLACVFLPLVASFLGIALIAAFVWIVLWFIYTSHACPSCHKDIAKYNALKRTLGITAPAITVTTTTTTTTSGSPPLYSS